MLHMFIATSSWKKIARTVSAKSFCTVISSYLVPNASHFGSNAVIDFHEPAPDTENQCPFQAPQISEHHRTCQRNCSRAPTISILRSRSKLAEVKKKCCKNFPQLKMQLKTD